MMRAPVKLYPFNADKTYIFSSASKLANENDASFASYFEKEPDALGSSKVRALPFIVAASTGRGDVFADEGATRFYFVLESSGGTAACGFRTDAAERSGAEMLSKFSVKNGDHFTVPANTPYMLGEGVSFIEVYSTASDLHSVEEDALKKYVGASAASPLLKKPAYLNENEGFSVKLLCACESFTAAQITVSGRYSNTVGASSFRFLFCLDGGAHIHYDGGHADVKAGDCLFLPARMGDFSVEGGVEFLSFNK